MATRLSQDAESAADDSDQSERPKNMGVPRYEQSFINPSLGGAESNIDTMSHQATTVASNQEVASDHLGGGSLYSYVSTRDIREFVREASGRCVIFHTPINQHYSFDPLITRIFNSLCDTYLLPTGKCVAGLYRLELTSPSDETEWNRL